jgi:DNA-directed RNA polymerase sigma subunit (sigma70/sigma32)
LKKLFPLLSAAAGTKSIQAPCGTDPDSGTLEQNLSDREALSPRELFDRASTAEALDAALARLPICHAELIRCRFGLGGEAPMTLREYGQKIGITGERVRQIEFKAIRKLREMLTSKLPLGAPLPEPRVVARVRGNSKTPRTIAFPHEMSVQRAA